jgi:hypothetical protein
MFTTIKQKTKKAWQWIKDKCRRFKRWILVTILGASVLAAPVADRGINPYTQVGEKHQLEVAGETVKIGGEGSSFKPEVHLGKWSDEVWMKIKLPTTKNIKPSRGAFSNKLKWKDTDREVHFYPTISPSEEKADALEFEVILKKKPKTNKIVLNIETQGLKFYYQPPLNQEKHAEGVVRCTETDCYDKDGNVVVHRPENVVGSYAVYHESKTGDYSKMGGKNYMAGKAFHIYRPKIVDASGNWVWGKLGVDEKKGILSVKIPQGFLEEAVYPVRVDPTFGYDTAGGSSDNWVNYIQAYKYTITEDGTADSLSFYAETTGPVGKAHFVIYDTSDNRVDYSTEVSGVSWSLGWQTLDVAVGADLTANTDYQLGYFANDNDFLWYYDSGTSIGIRELAAYSYPPPASITSTSDNQKYSIYCTYTAAAAAAPSRNRLIIIQ